eukprot:403357430
MKPATFQVNFKDFPSQGNQNETNQQQIAQQNQQQALPQQSQMPNFDKIQMEFLPCQFQKNIDECNKDVYFDSIKKKTNIDGVEFDEVSLQGRKMIGREVQLPEGYKGLIFGKMNQQLGYLGYDGHSEKIDLDGLAEFTSVHEWKKDQWSHNERGYISNLFDYLDCSKILHAE